MRNQPAITLLGEKYTQGVYLLHITVATPISVAFGRFQGGRPLPLPAGDYLYVGSALGRRGATSLAGRLVRHATRSGNLPRQMIHTPLLAQLQKEGLIAHNRATLSHPKRCFWHIDYLVDQVAAEIRQIIALRTTDRCEAWLARWLATEAGVSALAPGLGASDDPHATHLLRVDAPATWWETLPARMMAAINEQTK